jgi:hypothetical protein
LTESKNGGPKEDLKGPRKGPIGAQEEAPKRAQEAWKISTKRALGGREMGPQMEPRGAREGVNRRGKEDRIK